MRRANSFVLRGSYCWCYRVVVVIYSIFRYAASFQLVKIVSLAYDDILFVWGLWLVGDFVLLF